MGSQPDVLLKVLDDVDSFNEFVDMDMLETAILAVFPAVDGFGEEYDLEQDAQFKVRTHQGKRKPKRLTPCQMHQSQMKTMYMFISCEN